LPPGGEAHYFTRVLAACCYPLIAGAGLDTGMEESSRPRYAPKIGQQVYRHTGGAPSRGGKRTGPYMIVGMVRQADGASLYRISGPKGEQLADASELKLALGRKEIEE